MRALALAGLLLLAAAAPAAAHHPGSNLGLARFLDDPLEDAQQSLVSRLPTVDAKLAAWDAAWPDLVERRTIGETSSGFPLYNVRITDETVAFDEAPLSTHQKLRVYLDGGHHGNEYLGVDIVMYYLESLLALAASDDEATVAFLRTTEVYATPMINVDGNTLDTRKNSNLVDPNRNYDFHWGEEGAGKSVTDFTYHGPAPFSEAETRANADFQTEISPDMVITMHTGIAEFYWPWGWTHDPSPDDAFFTSLEKPFEDATNGRVDAMQGAELYIVAGASDDWAYGVLGTPGYTYEVHEDQNIPVYGQPIPQVIADQLAGLDFMVRNVQRQGAWVEAVPTPEGWNLVNQGWGAAPRVEWEVDGQRGVVENLTVNATATLPGGASVRWSYPILFVDASRVRTHETTLAAASGVTVEPAPVPALGLLGALGAAAVALALRRR